MECERPVTIQDPRKPDLRDRNGTRLNVIQVSCGRCAACQSNHRKMWFFRLKVESNKCVSSYCVTLTYNDDVIPPIKLSEDGSVSYHPIDYSHVQLFNKRLRKALGPFRFFCVCEYGPEHLRPHYHILYFLDHVVPQVEFEDVVFRSWFPDCRITVDTTNDKAAEYVLSYCLATVGNDIPKEFWPKLRCSTKPFIGAGLLDNEEFLRWLHVKRSDLSSYCGYRQRLPRIFRDRIFSDDEKKFIQKELGRLMSEGFQKKYDSMLEKEKQYGIEKAVEYTTMSRTVLNARVKRQSKLKAIK